MKEILPGWFNLKSQKRTLIKTITAKKSNWHLTCFPWEVMVPRKHNVGLDWKGKERQEEEEAEVVPCSSPCPGNDPKVIFQSHSPAHCFLSYSCGKKREFISISLTKKKKKKTPRDVGAIGKARVGDRLWLFKNEGSGKGLTETIPAQQHDI